MWGLQGFPNLRACPYALIFSGNGQDVLLTYLHYLLPLFLLGWETHKGHRIQ